VIRDGIRSGSRLNGFPDCTLLSTGLKAGVIETEALRG
jgi:hypothetical protein